MDEPPRDNCSNIYTAVILFFCVVLFAQKKVRKFESKKIREQIYARVAKIICGIRPLHSPTANLII